MYTCGFVAVAFDANCSNVNANERQHVEQSFFYMMTNLHARALEDVA